MVSTRSKPKLNKPHTDPPSTTDIFKTLISALESLKGIKSQFLKSSYHLLYQLSSNQQLCLGKGTDLNELLMKTNEAEVRLSLRDIYKLSSIFFKDLQKRLNQLRSSKHDVSTNRSHELEELNLLIRCCMVTLTLFVPQQHLLDSGRILLSMFKNLSLLQVAEGCHGNLDFNKSISCQCMYSGEKSSDSFAKVASLEIFEPCIPSITSILEVVIDELSVHSRLRKYLQIVDSFSSPNDRLFKHGADYGVMMEMICSHFLLTIFNEVTLQQFLNEISSFCSSSSKSVEISILASRTLLQNPILFSSPKLLQAHIISLVSDVISVLVDDQWLKTDPRLIDSYLSILESSVTLYTRHMSVLKTEKNSTDSQDSLVNVHSQSSDSHYSFENFIDPDKLQKLNQTIIMLNDSWNSNLRRKFFKRKLDLLASSIEYVEQSLSIFDLEYRDEVLSVLRCILTRAANDVNNIEFPLNGDASLQDICVLASLLKLISNSLIQSVWCLRYGKEYDLILRIINCFKEFSIRLPIQIYSYNKMENHPTESRLMLLHFLGLLSLSFDSGVDFLVKSCVSVIIALTNLFILEEGNIEMLSSLADANSVPFEGSIVIYKEAPVSRYSIHRMAESFQEIRTLYVSNEEDVEETCSGEMYLKTRLKGWSRVTDFDDLADFVECKKGKNYDTWGKNREKYRQQKLKKVLKRRWEKQKQAWRSMV